MIRLISRALDHLYQATELFAWQLYLRAFSKEEVVEEDVTEVVERLVVLVAEHMVEKISPRVLTIDSEYIMRCLNLMMMGLNLMMIDLSLMMVDLNLMMIDLNLIMTDLMIIVREIVNTVGKGV